MKIFDFAKLIIALLSIVCLYLIALSNRYEVMDEDGYKVFDKWECCVKYMEVGNDGFYKYRAIQEDVTVSKTEVVDPKKDALKTTEGYIRELYDALSDDYNLGDYESFTKKIKDSAMRRKAYDTISKKYNIGTYEEYERKLGFSTNKKE